MADEPKTTPGGVPFVADEMAEILRRSADQAELAAGVSIRLTVEGGHADERYEYRFLAMGSGELDCELHCRMTGRDGRVARAPMQRDDFIRLVRSVEIPALQSARRALRRIPPCSLIGRLEITDGVRQISLLFMADPGQAESAGYEVPAPLARVIEDIYAIGAKYMEAQGIKSVRP
jgi:hypothetical protein